MTTTLVNPKTQKRIKSIPASLPEGIPAPSLSLFAWVQHQDTSGYEDEDEGFVEYEFIDRGRITGIKWDGKEWLYSVQFYAQYATHSDGSMQSSDEEIDDFSDYELTLIEDPRR